MKIPKNVSSGGCMRTPISPWPITFDKLLLSHITTCKLKFDITKLSAGNFIAKIASVASVGNSYNWQLFTKWFEIFYPCLLRYSYWPICWRQNLTDMSARRKPFVGTCEQDHRKPQQLTPICWTDVSPRKNFCRRRVVPSYRSDFLPTNRPIVNSA